MSSIVYESIYILLKMSNFFKQYYWLGYVIQWLEKTLSETAAVIPQGDLKQTK